MILAIDPGSSESGFVEFHEGRVLAHGILSNDEMLGYLESCEALECVIEYTPPYVMRTAGGGSYVPHQVFDTAFYCGRLSHEWEGQRGVLPTLFSRKDVKKHLGLKQNANDSAVRATLVDRYGGKEEAIGKKASPGPLYGIKSHVWAALAVAVTFEESRRPAF